MLFQTICYIALLALFFIKSILYRDGTAQWSLLFVDFCTTRFHSMLMMNPTSTILASCTTFSGRICADQKKRLFALIMNMLRPEFNSVDTVK